MEDKEKLIIVLYIGFRDIETEISGDYIQNVVENFNKNFDDTVKVIALPTKEYPVGHIELRELNTDKISHNRLMDLFNRADTIVADLKKNSDVYVEKLREIEARRKEEEEQRRLLEMEHEEEENAKEQEVLPGQEEQSESEQEEHETEIISMVPPTEMKDEEIKEFDEKTDTEESQSVESEENN